MNLKKTTDVELLKLGHPYTHGFVVGLRQFKHTSLATTYAIVEFIDNDGKRGFAPYVNGVALSVVAPTFEDALIAAANHVKGV